MSFVRDYAGDMPLTPSRNLQMITPTMIGRIAESLKKQGVNPRDYEYFPGGHFSLAKTLSRLEQSGPLSGLQSSLGNSQNLRKLEKMVSMAPPGSYDFKITGPHTHGKVHVTKTEKPGMSAQSFQVEIEESSSSSSSEDEPSDSLSILLPGEISEEESLDLEPSEDLPMLPSSKMPTRYTQGAEDWRLPESPEASSSVENEISSILSELVSGRSPSESSLDIEESDVLEPLNPEEAQKLHQDLEELRHLQEYRGLMESLKSNSRSRQATASVSQKHASVMDLLKSLSQ